MTEEEYKIAMKDIEDVATEKRRYIMIKYAMDQVKYKIGDIIQDNRYIIKIDKITTYKGLGLPEPVYKGFVLKKDLTITKKKETGAIYGNKDVVLIKSNTNE